MLFSSLENSTYAIFNSSKHSRHRVAHTLIRLLNRPDRKNHSIDISAPWRPMFVGNIQN